MGNAQLVQRVIGLPHFSRYPSAVLGVVILMTHCTGAAIHNFRKAGVRTDLPGAFAQELVE
jgi:hypothetical protein